MTIANQSDRLLENVLAAQTTRQDAAVAVLKKSQDALKMEAQGLLQVLEESAPPAPEPLLDAYA